MAITDPYDSFTPALNGPVIGGFDVTPDDVTDLPVLTRALMVTTAGDVAVTCKDGTTVTLPGLTPGLVYPVRAARVLAAGTSATGIKGLY